MDPRELKEHELWWRGPPWLSKDPVILPPQPQASEIAKHQSLETKPAAVLMTRSIPPAWWLNEFKSYRTLLLVVAWMKRFVFNIKSKVHLQPTNRMWKLSVEEVDSAEQLLLLQSQERCFPAEQSHLSSSPPKPIYSTSKLLTLHPFLGQDGLLHVGGRLANADIPLQQKFPIILSSHDPLTKLMYQYRHEEWLHCGPSLLSSNIGETYHVLGSRQLARTTYKSCITCRKAAATIRDQLMGQLPEPRVTISSPFTITGVDYAGPFTIKRGHTRRPVLVKAYLAIFVCFSTKAVHLEIVSDRTTEAFLASLKRFISRRGRPNSIYSDNGSNFIGARNDLRTLYQFLSTPSTEATINSYLLNQRVDWHTIPERAPHFGGLWEAGVKSVKYHLKRVVGQQKLTYEEFSTVSAQVEVQGH